MKKILFFITMIIGCLSAFAQSYPGYNTSNYSGVNGTFFNPANIADSRYRWDINLFAINTTVANDYASIKTSNISNIFKSNSKLDSFITRTGVANANLFLNFDVFGPSFMVNIDKKNSFAITTRGRAMVNIDKIPNSLLNTLENNGDNITFPSSINSDRFAITGHAWSEIGFTYGRVIADNKTNFFKGGVTIKYLGGVGSGYFVSSAFNGTINKDNSGDSYLQNATGQILFGSSGLTDNKIKLDFSGSGVGADIGFVYEYRPKEINDKSANKYKFKVDIALHDLGNISYNHSSNDGAYALNIPADTLRLDRFSGVSSFDDLNNAITAANPKITKTTTPSGNYQMALPTSLTGSVDYNFVRGLYVNLGGMLSLNEGSSKAEKTHVVNYLAITPRYERRWYGISVPLTINEISGFTAGLSMRAGPMFFGSGSLLSTLLSGKTKQVDFHVGLHVGILKKNKKPAIKKEKEEVIAAPKKIIDTDGDGIPDDVDKCPTVPGLARYNGCPIPDSDSDGVNDEEDKCPTIPGLARYHGCPIPDTDGDGINDEEDKCPTVPGVAKYHGCPIPDSDSDGVNDEEDKCPTVPGLKRYHGCPIPDSDSDGVNDEEDKCPTVKGPASNHGCPVIKKEIIQKVNFAAKGLLFQTGKAIILKKSYLLLDNVVKVLKSDSTLNLDITGHTDNVGDSTKNIKLSTDRANAAKAYFVKKGIAENRLSTEGFGPTRPIASNKTPQGRAKNRRVEFTLKNY